MTMKGGDPCETRAQATISASLSPATPTSLPTPPHSPPPASQPGAAVTVLPATDRINRIRDLAHSERPDLADALGGRLTFDDNRRTHLRLGHYDLDDLQHRYRVKIDLRFSQIDDRLLVGRIPAAQRDAPTTSLSQPSFSQRRHRTASTAS
jgi:hypothetical protein